MLRLLCRTRQTQCTYINVSSSFLWTYIYYFRRVIDLKNNNTSWHNIERQNMWVKYGIQKSKNILLSIYLMVACSTVEIEGGASKQSTYLGQELSLRALRVTFPICLSALGVVEAAEVAYSSSNFPVARKWTKQSRLLVCGTLWRHSWKQSPRTAWSRGPWLIIALADRV